MAPRDQPCVVVVVVRQQPSLGFQKRPTAFLGGPDTYTRTEGSWAPGNDPPLYAHMPLRVLRSHTPGRRPRTPVKTGARVRRFRECNQATSQPRRVDYKLCDDPQAALVGALRAIVRGA